MRENAGKMRTKITPNTDSFYAGNIGLLATETMTRVSLQKTPKYKTCEELKNHEFKNFFFSQFSRNYFLVFSVVFLVLLMSVLHSHEITYSCSCCQVPDHPFSTCANFAKN